MAIGIAGVVTPADDHRPLAIVGLDQQRLSVDVPEVGILELPTDNAGCIRFRKIGRVGDIQRYEPRAPGSHAGHQQCVPSASVEDVTDGRRAINVIAMCVRRTAQLAQRGVQHRRNIGKHLCARCRVDRVQHAVVAAYVDHWSAIAVGRRECAVGSGLEVICIAE